MKKILIYTLLAMSASLGWVGCKKSNYPGGDVSPFIPIYDLRNIYKGSDITLTVENMFGSGQISGIVVSDHREGNMPAGLLILQDKKRLNQLRGIAIPLGTDANSYLAGDSVIIDIEGAVLTREGGLMFLKGIAPNQVKKISSDNVIATNRVPASRILGDPARFESTLVAIVKGGIDPVPDPSVTLSGNKSVNDGFDYINVYTEPTAAFANKNNLPALGNYFGIVFNDVVDGKLVPKVRMRKESDVVKLDLQPQSVPVVIAGWCADPQGTDANNEYIQFLATRDINFATSPISIVTTNNAGASEPTGFPTNGWAAGGLRTYKFNVTSGSVLKGNFFYVGGTGRLINSTGSTSIASSNWPKTRNYNTTAGEGFGSTTSNLLANSGNAYGIAVFAGTTVTASSVPMDVVFVGGSGSLFSPEGNGIGYRIGNTDFYDTVDPITMTPQPFYLQGTNTLNYIYTTPSDAGFYYKMGGVYSSVLGRWVKARTQFNFNLTKTSTIDEIEGMTLVQVINERTGEEIRIDTVRATSLKD